MSIVPAHAARNAAIVVDANNGKVLQQSNADAPRYPASITKVMTLYLLFEALEKGRLTLDSKLSISSYAASRPPSKLGLRPGDTIRVRDAILALVTRSANDIATAIAENIAGSESAFAVLMTKKARSLGMANTTFKNASGLPHPQQKTTARDLATLGRAIYERFPTYSKYFSTRAYYYRGRGIANHNKLLGRVNGVDGIKTGYTNASGYNLLTSVHNRGRHLVAVVLGGSTGARRDAAMRMLIANYLPQASSKKVADKQLIARIYGKDKKDVALAMSDKARKKSAKDETFAQAAEAIEDASSENAMLALAPAAIEKKDLNDIVAPALAAVEEGDGGSDDSEGDESGSSPMIEAEQAQRLVAGKLSQEWKNAEAPLIEPKQVTTVKVSREEMMAKLDTSEIDPVEETATAVAPEASSVSGWAIQLAATNSESKAMELLSEAAQKLKLANLQPFTERIEKGAAILYRARFRGFTERKLAEATCSALKRQSYSCMTVRL